MAESLVAGNGWINAHNVFVHGVPYGGVNLSGMGGGVLGPDTLFDYLRSQSIVRPFRTSSPEPVGSKYLIPSNRSRIEIPLYGGDGRVRTDYRRATLT